MAELVSAKEQHCQELAKCATVSAERTLADERCCWEVAECSATLAETALAKEQRCTLLVEAALAECSTQTKTSWDATAVEVAKHATTLAVTVLAKLDATPKLRYGRPLPTHFSPPLTAAEVAELNAAILDKRRRRKTAVQEKVLHQQAISQQGKQAALPRVSHAGESISQRCMQATLPKVGQTHCSVSKVGVEQTAVLADSALPRPALTKDKRHQEEAAKKQRCADNKCIMALVLPPNPVNVAIRCIWVECALLAAPLDAILAKIECNNIVHKAGALPMTTLPHPAAMLSTPPCPMTYVGAALFTMGGGPRATSLALATFAIPSPIVDSQLWTKC